MGENCDVGQRSSDGMTQHSVASVTLQCDDELAPRSTPPISNDSAAAEGLEGIALNKLFVAKAQGGATARAAWLANGGAQFEQRVIRRLNAVGARNRVDDPTMRLVIGTQSLRVDECRKRRCGPALCRLCPAHEQLRN